MNRPLDPRLDRWGSYSMWVRHRPMTTTHKLIFVSSFFVLMNWGVRVTEAVIHALY